MMESEEFKKLLFKLVAYDYKEVSIWINKVKKQVIQSCSASLKIVFCCNKTQTFLVDSLYIEFWPQICKN